MKKCLAWLLVAMPFFVAAPALAQDRNRTAEELLHKCGLWEQLAAIEPQVLAGMAQGAGDGLAQLSAPERARLEKVVKASYSAPRLRASATRIVAKGLSERHLSNLRSWYESPVGLAITRAEEQSASSQADPSEQLAQGMEVLSKSSPQRRALLNDLIRESKATEVTVETILNTSIAMLRGVAAANPDTPAPSPAEIKQMFEAGRPALLKRYAQLNAVSFARTYQSVSDADLGRYRAFMASPSGRHFNALVMQALNGALTEAGEGFGRNLASTKDSANL